VARVLIDECLDWRLARYLSGHSVETVRSLRWSGLADRTLLERIPGRFDVLLTADKALPSQQDLRQKPFCVVILRPARNRLADVLSLLPRILAALEDPQAGVVVEIGPDRA
jgi:predicted nuclease of predicted toxin-antitoxin system